MKLLIRIRHKILDTRWTDHDEILLRAANGKELFEQLMKSLEDY